MSSVVTGVTGVTLFVPLAALPTPTPRQTQTQIGTAMVNTQEMQPIMEVTTIRVIMLDVNAKMRDENNG